MIKKRHQHWQSLRRRKNKKNTVQFPSGSCIDIASDGRKTLKVENGQLPDIKKWYFC